MFKENLDHVEMLRMCIREAQLSLDPSTKLGSVLCPAGQTPLIFGHNRFPPGIDPTPVRLTNRALKLTLTIHAEVDAILRAAEVGIATNKATLYFAATDAKTGQVWGGPPCMHCCAAIITAGITRVISPPAAHMPLRWADACAQGDALLREAGVERQEIPL